LEVDSRSKIVDAREATEIAAGGATVVSGYFDPMIAWHARWLSSFKKPGQKMLVLIATPEHPILPARARAELVAALGIVDHVAEYSEEVMTSIAATGGDAGAVIRVEAQDRELFQDLLELVHSRQSGAPAAN
jgi:glycerol-3-phosphate cytidylyltransferase-like family protein